MDTSKSKEYDLRRTVNDFAGYISSVDKTNLKENYLVQGSQNVYKKLSGTIAVRPGQKRQGDANSTLSPCSSEFVWNTSWGETFTLVVADSTLYAVKDETWYELQTGLTQTRYVFDNWWSTTLNQDLLLFVNGTSSLFEWPGGFATISSSAATTITKSGTTTWKEAGFLDTSFSTIGSSTTQFDITNPAGTTFRYTYDGTGTDPSITSTSVPIGSYILIGAQNFNSANNGIFIVTGSGANYFEVTNASGVVESNKTIGTGYIYRNYTKVITIGGTLYAYTGGESTTTLTGVTPNASAVTGTALSAVITWPNTPTSTFTSDFLRIINNQVYLGSYNSLKIFMSSNTDFTNYTVPTPQLDGSPGLFIMPAVAKGIGVRQGKAHIGSGANYWVIISFDLVSNNNIITRNNTIDIKPVAYLQAPYSHEFIDSVGDNLVYLAQDQQVRSFGDFNNLFATGYPSLSQEVATELAEENFTNGALRAIGEFIYITAPNSGKVYLRQERTRLDEGGSIVSEKLWHSPFIWNATRIDQIEGVVVAFSNANPQIYEVWDTNQWYDDSPSDEHLPYECVAAFSYRGEERRQGLWSFDKQFTEGYITAGTTLNCLMNYNYDGATNSTIFTVNSVTLPAYLFQPDLSSLGDSSLGEESLGNGGITDLANTLPKFKVFNSLPLINCFEWQPIYYSDSADAQWELLAVGDNARISTDQNATFIINKLRN